MPQSLCPLCLEGVTQKDPNYMQLYSYCYRVRGITWNPGPVFYVTIAAAIFANVAAHAMRCPQSTTLCHLHAAYRSTRVGEASHPGPRLKASAKIRLAIVNPTAVTNKNEEFSQLCHVHDCNLIAMSETSATWFVQNQFSQLMRTMGYQTIFSDPVRQQRVKLDGSQCLRGRAGGTALSSQVPCRTCRFPMHEKWQVSTRLLHTIVQLGSTHVQLFIIYGATRSISNAMEYNESLATEAVSRAAMLPIPAMFVGDFNCNPSQLQAFQPMMEQGYQQLEAIYEQLYVQPMPFTCKDATHVDTALIHPALVPFVSQIEVLQTHLFDAHNPVIVELQMPQKPVQSRRYQIPKSWSDLPISPRDLQDTIDNHPTWNQDVLDIPSWCAAVEHVVDLSLRRQHQADPDLQPYPKLPKAYKGRGTPKTPKNHPYQSRIKPGRNGDYEPQTEFFAIKTKRQVRQLRRIQSLMRQVHKIQSWSDVSAQRQFQLQQEWQVICQDRSLGMHFAAWAQGQPEIGPLPRTLPVGAFIHDVYQLFKHHVDIQVYEDGKLRYQLAKWATVADKKYDHSKKAFAITRGKSNPPVHRLATPFHELGLCITQALADDGTYAEIAVEDPMKYHLHFPLRIAEVTWWIHNITCHSLEIFTNSHHTLPEEVQLQQTVEHFDHDAIFSQLQTFWAQYWQRDAADDQPSPQDLQAFQALLQSLPPDLMQMQIQTTNVNDWIEAINSTKASSAPGVDGVRASELQCLPVAVIQSLAHVVQQEPGVIPSQLMQGRTIPIPKNPGICQVHQVRPITILPQIYRIWGKVVTTKILEILSKQLPPQISGFLKGRSAFQAAYDTQVWLEQQASLAKSRGGVTLDLVKCYNLIRRCFATAALRAFKIPSAIISQWSVAMANLTRFWEISGIVSPSQPTTAGCAEGDPIAVAVMVCLAAIWVFNTPYTNDSLRINSYADNWSWASLDSQLHAPVAKATDDLCRCARLQIDATKTWLWASDATQEVAIRSALSAIMPAAAIQQVAGAKDLGLQMHYVGNARPGCLKERLNKGLQRLQNVLHQEWDLDVKLHMVRSSVYAACFHGSEMYPLSSEDLHKVRSAVAQCLTQDYAKSQTPVLCTMFMSSKVQDPELYVILAALKTARKWILQATAEAKARFLALASRHTGNKSTKGPASVLKDYILRLGWVISPQGALQVGPCTIWYIDRTSFAELKWWAIRSWSDTAIVLHSRRFKVFNLPRPDVIATYEVLGKYPPSYRKLLLREIAQSFQTGQQKSHWTLDDAVPCQFCGAPDTRQHRLTECPAFQVLRDQHAPAIQLLVDETPGWIEMPVIYQSPLYDFIPSLHDCIPECQVLHSTKEIIRTHIGTHVTLYTDGSSKYQSSPSTRFASYALVADFATNNAQRLCLADRFQTNHTMPDTLQVIHRGRVNHRQGIHRAELTIIIIAAENFPSFDLYTDSAVSLAAIRQVREAQSKCDFHDHAEFDLMCRLFDAIQPTQHFHKIKAHVNLDDHPCDLKLYHFLGNKCANDAAIAANKELQPELYEEFEAFHRELSGEQRALKQVYDYLIALQTIRTKVDQTNTNMGLADQCQVLAADPCTLFSQWNPADFWQPPQRIQPQGLQHCAYGWQVAFAVMKFLQQFRWPTLEFGPLPEPVGISWTEMAVGMMLELNAYLPVKRQTADGQFVPVFLPTYTDATFHHTSMAEQADMARILFGQVTDLIPERLFPDTRRGQVKSLYMMGESHFAGGLELRPAIPRQDVTMQTVKQFLASDRQLVDFHFPGIEQWQVDKWKSSLTWQQRQQRMAEARRRVRQVRQSGGD